MIKKLPLAKLVEDLEFYPRNEVSGTVVTSFVDAMAVGEKFPPLVVCDRSFRIVDGWHRYRAFKRLRIESVMCDVRHFASDTELFKSAVELNSSHGRRLDSYDIKRSVLRLQELGLEIEQIAGVVRVPAPRIEDMIKGMARGLSGPIALKAGVAYLADRKLTANQQKAVGKASGMQALYHVNQLILLIENGIAPTSESFASGMDRLVKLWKEEAKK